MIQSEEVIDAFCGAGGASIAMARIGKMVTAIEINPDRFRMAKHNVSLFEVRNRITFIQGDLMKFIPKLKVGAVYLDLPWGGPEYDKLGNFSLACFKPDGAHALRMALENANEVILKVPKNFNFDELNHFDLSKKIIQNKLDGQLEYYTVFFWK